MVQVTMTMTLYPIFAIDPGPTQSGWVRYRGAGFDVESGVDDNARMRNLAHAAALRSSTLAIEMIASYGKSVGADVFSTCVEIGRFVEVADRCGVRVLLVPRLRVKMALCHSARATDANVRQALIDRFGGKERAVGRRAAPGPLYGVKSHAWAALAVACCVEDGLEPMRVMT